MDSEIEKIEELERQVKSLTAENKKLTGLVAFYEQGGPAKLYYALSRKSIEMADLLNSQKLTDIDIDDGKSKGFERIMVIIKNSTDVAASVQSLGAVAGITGDEERDTKGVRRAITPETMANDYGNTAGQRT